MDASFSLHVTILPSLVAIDIVVKAITLIYQMTLHDHVPEGSCKFMGGISLLHVTTLPSFLATYIVVGRHTFPEMRVTRKISTGRPQIYFFNQFSRDILFSSLVSFAYLDS